MSTLLCLLALYLSVQPYLESLFVFDQFSGLLSSALVCHNNIAGLYPPELVCLSHISVSHGQNGNEEHDECYWECLGNFG